MDSVVDSVVAFENPDSVTIRTFKEIVFFN